MIWQLDIILLVLTVLSAVAAISVKDLLASVILLGAYSLFMCLLWVEMGAVDVAFTEASVGAGISTVLMVIAVFKTERRSRD
jgi:energy-converting hydrogenase B subunit D